MAKKAKREEAQTEAEEIEPIATEFEVTSPPVETAPDSSEVADAQAFEPEAESFEDEDEYEEDQLPPVNPDISSDPSSTVAAAILAIGRLYNDAGVIAAALTKHLREQAGQPELQGFLQRMQTTLGDTRHAIESIEQSTSEYLRDAIVKGVS